MANINIMDWSKQNIVIITTIALLISAVGYIVYDKATGKGEVVIPSDAAAKQLVMPPEPETQPANETLTAELDLAKSIFAQGQAGEEITGTVVFIDYSNGVVYFTETTTGELYYTIVDVELSELMIDGIPVTLAQFYEGMPLTVRWTDEPVEVIE